MTGTPARPGTPPKALLLDFGGVVIETTSQPGWIDTMAAEIHEDLVAAGCTELSEEDIRVDIDAGRRADSLWKNAMSRPPAPIEMTHRRFWSDFVAADWPAAARELVTAHATPLAHRMGMLRSSREVRPGMKELLAVASEARIPVGIVSNALCGQVHRDFLAGIGWDSAFALEVYSDEVGIRKPNPEIIAIAARALGVDVGETWYVGDNFDRDVVCGRRAGAGRVILMEARSTYKRPYVVRDQPDVIVADPTGLLDELRRALDQQDADTP